MTVLFRPERVNTPLQPNKTPQLLQGFLNIQGILNVKNGELTEPQLERYNSIKFFLPDVNAPVADYFTRNFNQIAPLDGNPESISTEDLVVRRPELPSYTRQKPSPPNRNSGEAVMAAHNFHLDDLFQDN